MKALGNIFLMVFFFVIQINEVQAVANQLRNKHFDRYSTLEHNAGTLRDGSRSEMDYEIGRRLTLREKLAIEMVKRRIKDHPQAEVHNEGRINGLAVVGFLLGLFSLFVFGLILGLLGVVLSGIAYNRIRKGPVKRRGSVLAIVGLV